MIGLKFLISQQGGLKAVVWTDSVQTGIMYIGTLLVCIAGTMAAGGFKKVHAIAKETDRFRFDK